MPFIGLSKPINIEEIVEPQLLLDGMNTKSTQNVYICFAQKL